MVRTELFLSPQQKLSHTKRTWHFLSPSCSVALLSVSVCVHACVHGCACVHMYVCMSVCMRVCMCMHACSCVQVFMCVCMCVSMCTYACAWMCACVCAYVQSCICAAWTCACVHVYAYIWTCVCMCVSTLKQIHSVVFILIPVHQRLTLDDIFPDLRVLCLVNYLSTICKYCPCCCMKHPSL